jgi:hypothetical protein
MLVGDARGSKGMAEAIDHAQSILESVLREAKTAGAENAARWGFSAESSTTMSPNNKLPIIKPNARRAFQPVACARPDKPCTTLLEQIGQGHVGEEGVRMFFVQAG